MRLLTKHLVAVVAFFPVVASGQSLTWSATQASASWPLASQERERIETVHFTDSLTVGKETAHFSDTRLPVFDKASATLKQLAVRPGSRWFTSPDESPYKLNVRRGAPIVGLGVGLVGASFVCRNSKTPLTITEVEGLNRKNIWSFDRGATSRYSATAGRMSDFVLYSSIATPWLYLTAQKTRRDFGRIVIMQFETGLVAYGLVSLTKAMTNRVRPFAYNDAAPLDKKLTMNAKESFFSGHTSTTAAMSFFMASTFSQYYPDSPWKPVIWTYAAVWPAAAGYLRYRAGSHYPTDIISGYLIGAASGIIIPKIHQKIKSRKKLHTPVY